MGHCEIVFYFGCSIFIGHSMMFTIVKTESTNTNSFAICGVLGYSNINCDKNTTNKLIYSANFWHTTRPCAVSLAAQIALSCPSSTQLKSQVLVSALHAAHVVCRVRVPRVPICMQNKCAKI